MTRRKVSPWQRQVPQAAPSAKPAEMSAAESDMISEGNPHTEEVAVVPAASSTEGAGPGAGRVALARSTPGQPEATKRQGDHEKMDQNVKADIRPPADESDLFQNQLSEVQWGRHRGAVVASWGRAWGWPSSCELLRRMW
jgi:hypothetical protein